METLTFLFTDIEGSTALLGRVGDDGYARVLAGHRALVRSACCAKTAEAIVRRCPRVHLVATSREPLGINGETIYRVPSLSLPASRGPGSVAPGSSDAVALFVDRRGRRVLAFR